MLAESFSPGKGGAIPSEAVTQAIAITDYVMDVWRSMDDPQTIAYTRKDEAMSRAVLAWRTRAESSPGKQVSTRELQRGHVGGVRTAAQMRDVLAAYEDHYPGSVSTEAEGGHGGRKITWVRAPARGGVSDAQGRQISQCRHITTGDIGKRRGEVATLRSPLTCENSQCRQLCQCRHAPNNRTDLSTTRYNGGDIGDIGKTGRHEPARRVL